jgi:hypothetical protein
MTEKENPMSDITTLKTLCDELKVDPKIARKRLRTAIEQVDQYPDLVKSHKHRGSWKWKTGDEAEQQARTVVGGMVLEAEVAPST